MTRVLFVGCAEALDMLEAASKGLIAELQGER